MIIFIHELLLREHIIIICYLDILVVVILDSLQYNGYLDTSHTSRAGSILFWRLWRGVREVG